MKYYGFDKIVPGTAMYAGVILPAGARESSVEFWHHADREGRAGDTVFLRRMVLRCVATRLDSTRLDSTHSCDILLQYLESATSTCTTRVAGSS
jgi:hypothetical protein